MLYTAQKYISDRCYNGVIISTLFVKQYCHVHFNGGGVVVLGSTCITSRNPLYSTNSFFFNPIYQRILSICTMALLYYYDQNTFRIFLFSFLFLNLVISGKSKALISLAYVSSETHNLQRVSRPGGGGRG